MVTTNIIIRTFHIEHGKNRGSAFTIEHNEIQYLITANHVLELEGVKNGAEIIIKIFHDSKWKGLRCNVFFHENPDIDIVVLKTEQVNFPVLPVEVGMGNLYLGSDTYFLGFPYGMFMDDKGGINLKFPIPFVKKGVVSAIDFQDGIKTIYIDAHNNNGFSGGPVFQMDKEKNVKIFGVNVSYIQHSNELNLEESDDDGEIYDYMIEYTENSGIMKAHGITHAIEIIEGNFNAQ